MKRLSSPTILVVDDDPDLVALLGFSFQEAGFSVLTASNGADALRRARLRPDLILLDLILPELDGFTVCETLKRTKATASIPVIMLTGSPSQLNRLAGLESGADDYVAKPVRPIELVQKIKALLSRRSDPPAGARVRPQAQPQPPQT